MLNGNGKMIGWKEQNKFGLERQTFGENRSAYRGVLD